MKCHECKDLLFDYYDNEISLELKTKMEQHFKICPSCQKEFKDISLQLNFFKTNMPVIPVEDNFTQKVMQNINSAQPSTSFANVMLGLGIILTVFALGLTVSIAPIMISLLTLLSSVSFGIISTLSAIGGMFPIIQISGSIILIIMLLGVSASIRHIVLHDSFK